MIDMSDFEQWFKQEHSLPSDFTLMKDAEGNYVIDSVHEASEVWQAAIASMQGEAVEITKDSKLPFSIRIGNGSIGKGCKFSTLLLRINAHNEWFAQQGFHLIPEKDAEIAKLQNELEEARKDAGRYKKLREVIILQPGGQYAFATYMGWMPDTFKHGFDQAIDAAIRQIGGGE